MKNSSSIKKFRDRIMTNTTLRGEVIDAQVCMSVALQLNHLRTYRKITQKQLAKILGVQQSNIARWESPGYQGYKVKMLSKIVRILGGRLSINIEPLIKNVSALTTRYEINPLPRQYHQDTIMIDDIEKKVVNEKGVFNHAYTA